MSAPTTARPTGATPTTVTSKPTRWTAIGTSVQGRPIRLQRIGTGPRTVLWIGGIHGDEPQGHVATDELPAAFSAAGLGDSVTLLIIDDLNPDGRAADTRGNHNGVDLNRNFPSANFDAGNPAYGGSPLSQPESRALYDLIQREHPALVMVAHAWRGDTFVNFDGPADAIAAKFAHDSGMRLQPSDDLADPTPGSLGSWVGGELHTPILTIEWLRGSDPVTDWAQTRTAILDAVRGT